MSQLKNIQTEAQLNIETIARLCEDDDKYIRAAWQWACEIHKEEKRLSGDDFTSHLLSVAFLVAEWGLGGKVVVAAILHEVLRKGVKEIDLEKKFGKEVRMLVVGIDKITSIRLVGSRDEKFVENLRKMLLVAARDLRVVLIKLADRLANMRTLEFLDEKARNENAFETLEIYAPLAERLGMGKIKGELEDLAFRHAYPKEFEELTKITHRLYKEGEEYIFSFKRELLKLAPYAGVNIRQKHLYSLWRKLARPDIDGDLAKVHDIVAARVITNKIEECYLALGAIHGKYRPVPYLGMRDFIANPKPNGYRSIHTNVFGPMGRIVEIQIRTEAMHNEAEMGVAAHWQYAGAKNKGLSSEKLDKSVGFEAGEKMDWARKLIAWQKEVEDSKEFEDKFKFETLANRILVFSPKGDVYDLPIGAVVMDFAYAVHTDLGNKAGGAKINGKMRSLTDEIRNGDVVEILVDKNRKAASRDWLEKVVTVNAKKQIIKSTEGKREKHL